MDISSSYAALKKKTQNKQTKKQLLSISWLFLIITHLNKKYYRPCFSKIWLIQVQM